MESNQQTPKGSGYTPAGSYNPTPASNTPPNYPPPRRSNNWIYLLVIAILLGACIYLVIDNRKKGTLVTNTIHERDTVIIAKENLQTEFNAAAARLDDLVSQNDDLKKEVNSQNGEIARLKTEFNDIMRRKNKSEADVKRANEIIRQLNKEIGNYQQRIAQLEGENRNLSSQVTTTTQERDEAVTQNAALKKAGSVLHASNIRMMAIDERRGGTKERETGRARKADVLRIIFDIDENRIAESGSKDLYLRITGPDGSLLSNAAYGSGTTTTAEGAALNYTMAKPVELQQGQPVNNVIVNWTQESDYKRGNYSIEIYNEGYRIGSGNVNLR